MELFISLASFVLSVIIIYYVVRKATRADEIVELLKKSLNEDAPAVVNVAVGVAEPAKAEKSDADYLREARAKAGM